MTLSDCIGLYLMLAAMAALPSISVMLVVSRTLSGGIKHGAIVSLGIVLADLLYLLIAIFGLTFVAIWLEQYWWLLQVLAIIILIIFSYQLWQNRQSNTINVACKEYNIWASFIAGFSLTIVDTKAIMFYLGILPIYLGSSDITLSSLLILLSTTAIAVASVKLVYVFLAKHVQQHIGVLQKSYRIMSAILFLAALWLSVNMALSKIN